MQTIDVRPEVAAFALLMEERLRANDHKGGWKKCHPRWLVARAEQELQELREALDLAECHAAGFDLIAREAADVADFAMMVADVCGVLAGEGETNAPTR